jgi:hypothetical protein
MWTSSSWVNGILQQDSANIGELFAFSCHRRLKICWMLCRLHLLLLRYYFLHVEAMPVFASYGYMFERDGFLSV